MIDWFGKRKGAKDEAPQKIGERQALLAEINAGLPPGIDWRQGALDYVAAEFRKHGQEKLSRYMLSKPFAPVPAREPGTPRAGGPHLVENIAYLGNFLNMIAAVDLPGGSRVLDVACGSGWVAQFLARMGYEAHGFDIAPDMVDLARRRFASDRLLEPLHGRLAERLFVLDIEREALPERLHGGFDAIVLESCMHHFLDPIAALEHLAAGLAPGGLVVIIEGESRQGPIRPEYLSVMREFDTLERPYSRDEFERILDMVGLGQREFFGRLNGWFSPRDPRLPHLAQMVRDDARHINFCIAAKSEAALARILPFRETAAEQADTGDLA